MSRLHQLETAPLNQLLTDKHTCRSTLQYEVKRAHVQCTSAHAEYIPVHDTCMCNVHVRMQVVVRL